MQLHIQPDDETTVMRLLPKLIWKEANVQEYQRSLDLQLQSHHIGEFSNLEQIIKASYPQVGLSEVKGILKKEPWFDDECQKARKASFAWLRMVRNSTQGLCKDFYIEANKKFKELCKSKKKLYADLQAEKLASCKNSADFWKLANKLNGKQFSRHTKLSTNILRSYFKDLLNPVTSPTKWHYAPPGFIVDSLDSAFTVSELEKTLVSLKDGKAAGSNGIPVEFFKYGTDLFKQKLLILFNKVLEGDLTPIEFRDAIIFPIHKKGSLLDATNYRGISFLNATYKILTTMLHKRLVNWMESGNLLTEFQAGFRSGYSAIDNIFIFRSLAENFLNQSKKLYVFFIDLKAAFDTIDRGALFFKLYSLGLSLKFARVLENLYSGTRSAVWSGEELSEWFETSSGVRQGCTLSPTLFALFINDLLDYLPGGVDFAGIKIKALLFADDIVMFAHSPETLQLMINRVYKYCQLWNLIVNIDKSKVMIIKRGGGRNASNERWRFNGEIIECVREYKYLGITVTNNFNMEKHLKDKLDKAKTAINMTWKKCFMNKCIAHSSKFKVFEAVAESILLYGAQVWGCTKYNLVEKLLTYFIKRIFHLPQNTPNYVIMLETGLSPLFIKTLKLQADYLLNVLKMNDSRVVKRVAIKALENQNSWYREWQGLAEECNINFSLSIEDLSATRKILYEVISKVDEKSRADYIVEASSSLHRTIYSRLNYNLSEKNYFHDRNNVHVISMMVRLRSELLDLNFIPHRDDLPLECNMCNLAQREDTVHFVGKCPILREIRRNIFGEDFLSEDQVISLLNQMDVVKLYEFCKIALRYRNAIMNEDF